MKKAVSKSEFKPKALEFLRKVQNEKKELIITDRGKPVLKIIPYEDSGPIGRRLSQLTTLQGNAL